MVVIVARRTKLAQAATISDTKPVMRDNTGRFRRRKVRLD